MFSKIYDRLRHLIIPFNEVVAKIPDRGNLLDLGSGYGTFCFLLTHKKGLNITGIEIDPRRVEIANKKAKNIQNLEFIAADVTGIQDTKKYDVVTCIDVFHHIDKSRYDQLLAKIHSLLTDNGLLIIKDMNTNPKVKYLWNYIHDILMTRSFDMNYISPRSFSDLLKKNKFNILSVENLSNILYAHYMIVAKKNYGKNY